MIMTFTNLKVLGGRTQIILASSLYPQVVHTNVLSKMHSWPPTITRRMREGKFGPKSLPVISNQQVRDGRRGGSFNYDIYQPV